MCRCVICMINFEKEEEVRCLKCKHLFHVDCIDEWLAKEKKCPVCKQEVL